MSRSWSVGYLRRMKLVDEVAFAETRRMALKEQGGVTPSNAEGFLLDLDYALEGAGLLDLKVSGGGGDDCGFTAVGQFAGNPEETAREIVALLAEKVTYGDGREAATVSSSAGHLRVSFLTWAPEIGVATVCIELTAAPG